jgi:flagellar hook assembly protein FlgD
MNLKKLTLFLVMAALLPTLAFATDWSSQGEKTTIAERVEFGIFIYENPANEKAEFEILTPEAVDISVLVYDNQGNVMFSQKGGTQITGSLNSLKINWDLKNRTGRRVTAGSYIIQATAKNATGNGIYQYFAQLGVRK